MCAALKDPSKGCEGAMVCREPTSGGTSISFGEPSDFSVVEETGFLKFTYGQGGNCGKLPFSYFTDCNNFSETF